eukprot:gene2340-17977_t
MELLNPAKIRGLGVKTVSIIGTEKARDHAVYKIKVTFGECSWIVRKRYRDFYALHEELVVSHGLPWDLLPPKKFIGNLNAEHIEKRRLALDKYLQNILGVLFEMPTEVVEFLEFDRFDVNSVCHKLAKDLYEIGDGIIDNDEVFTISPLQIHCINRRLLLPLPTCDSDDPKEDIGHLYSFVSQAKHIKVQGASKDNTFFSEGDLTFDVSIFKSLETLTLCGCDLELLNGLEVLQHQLWELNVARSLNFIKDILITANSWSCGVLTKVDQEGEQQFSSELPSWNKIVLAAFTNNQLTSIDNTITLLPNIRKLDLSHNLLTDVQFLESFLYLRDLDLSYNEITDVEDFPYKLGAISVLNLAGNRLRDVKGLEKMYSLKSLKISDNIIEKLANVLPLGNLPLLENIDIHGNPCTVEQFYNVRLIAQFGDRYEQVTVDGIPTCKTDLTKAREIIELQNSYELITGPENYYRPCITASSRAADPVQPLTPPRSPRHKGSKKHHIAEIKEAASNQRKSDLLSSTEKEEVKFREQVEKLKAKAGESWLSFYNELQIEETEQRTKKEATPSQRKIPEQKAEVKFNSTKPDDQNSKPVNKVKPLQLQSNNDVPDSSDERSSFRKVVYDVIREEKYEEKLPGAVINALEDMLDQNIDLVNETFLVFYEDKISGEDEEHIVTFDADKKCLMEIDLLSGRQTGQYHVDEIRNIRVEKKSGKFLLYFDEKDEHSLEKGLWLEKELKFKDVKDCAGLFALLIGYTEDNGSKNTSTDETHEDTKPEHVVSPMDNPFLLRNEVLLGFFQEFVQKTMSVRRDTEPRERAIEKTDSFSSMAYQNIGIGAPFLKHSVPSDTNQDVVLILWVGCLPYIFPEEELPTCLIMTNVNIFLFRVFLPEDTSLSALPKTVKEMKEIFHCFYSFSLKSIKEIVVGLYDQAFRIEVNNEGSRGTFTFLTRHASKTAQFLEAYCSVIGLGEEKSSLDMRRRTSFVSGDMTSCISYPDESKIDALKTQLTTQGFSPIEDRENLISYCIVYVFEDAKDQEEFLYATDIPVSSIKSLILTNLRLFMCDEDYVHWPPPSFVRSLPTTPEWVVDEEEPVAELIGVDLWQSNDRKYMLAGNYGMTLTFDDSVTEYTESLSKEDATTLWQVIFGSLSERDQFVRSLSCLWKNQFDQNLSVTHSKLLLKPVLNLDVVSEAGSLGNGKKGHTRVPSGNLSIPVTKPIEYPDMLMALNPVRQRSYFKDHIAQFEDEATKGIQFIMCSGCISYLHPEKEFTVVIIISCSNIYLISSEEDHALISAKKSILDGSGGVPLWLVSIDFKRLQQVVVGIFDQLIRLEGGTPDTTFTLTTRDYDKTNGFMKSLSEALLSGKPEDHLRANRTETVQNQIYKLYKKEDEESGAIAAASEFIHPNSEVKIVYPSDESLEKLKENIYDFISFSCEWHSDRNFGILLYLLVSAETEETVLPCTFIISENFVCLLKEDYVNYPLPMFAKELPQTPQYRPADIRLIAAIIRIEFQDLVNGTFSIVFNRAGVEPSCYDQRFKTSSVEQDFSLVTDLNTDERFQEEQGLLVWNLQTQSFNEREKIFNLLSKMWTSFYSGKTLPIVKRKNTRLGEFN